MALHGDFRTLPFPDLLQWLEGARRPGRLLVSAGVGERVFVFGPAGLVRFGAPGFYERMARLLQLMGALDEGGGRMAVEAARSGGRFEDALAAAGVSDLLALELAGDDAMQAVTDLFEDGTASFHFGEELEGADETARVEIGVRELLYEAARRHDEAGPALARIPSDALRVLPGVPTPLARGLSSAALAAVGTGATVGSVRLSLGLSREAAARILMELWRTNQVRIEGAEAPRPDPLTQMLEQGQRLLADEHFEAAALVFSSLLAADPTDRRVREFARAVEREHVDALYRKLSPVAVPRMRVDPASLASLRQDERTVAALINDRWDVSTLVLASPLRELQTLLALQRMSELGFIELGH